MVEVSEGGGDKPGNLLPLCPTCHALYHRRVIKRESIYVWKSVIVSLTRAFDVPTLDQLIFLQKTNNAELQVSGDGVLQFARIIGAGLAKFELTMTNGPLQLYGVELTPRGKSIIDAWCSGDRSAVEKVLTNAQQIAPTAAANDGALTA